MLNKIFSFLPNVFSFFSGFFIAKKQTTINQLQNEINDYKHQEIVNKTIDNMVNNANAINNNTKRMRIKKRKSEFNK